MSTVNELISQLEKVREEGLGDAAVYCVVGSSGVAYELGSVFSRAASETSEEYGPFDVDDDWVEIYGGN